MEARQSPTIYRIPDRKKNKTQNPDTMNRYAQRMMIAAAALLFIGQPSLQARPWHGNNASTEYQREAAGRHTSFSGELHLTREQEREFLSLRDSYEVRERNMERRLAKLRKEHRLALRDARTSKNAPTGSCNRSAEKKPPSTGTKNATTRHCAGYAGRNNGNASMQCCVTRVLRLQS